MQRKFILNLILLIFLNLLVKPFYILGIDTEFINRLGQETYGNYFALLNLTFLLNMFLDFGIINFNTKNLASHSQLITKHFSNILVLKILLAGVYILITFICAMVLGYRDHNLHLLIFLSINQVLAGFILYLRSNLAGLQLFAQDGLLSILDRLILIILCSAVLWGGVYGEKVSIELFIYLQTLAYIIGAITGFFLVFRNIDKLKLRWRPAFSLLILKNSLPYALLVILMGITYRTDGVMLERMLPNGAYEAGIYAQAFRFFEAGNMFAYLFAALLFPMFSRLIKEKQDIQELLSLSFRLITLGAIIAGIGGYFFSEEIMALRYDTEIDTSANAFKYLMIGYIGVSGTFVFGALLTANGSMKSLNYASIGGLILNILLNILLIPSLKAEGAAIASMITQLLLTATQVYLVYKILSVKINNSIWVKLFLLIAVIIITLLILDTTAISWFIQLFIFIAISLVLGLAFKLISIRAFTSLVSNSSVTNK